MNFISRGKLFLGSSKIFAFKLYRKKIEVQNLHKTFSAPFHPIKIILILLQLLLTHKNPPSNFHTQFISKINLYVKYEMSSE